MTDSKSKNHSDFGPAERGQHGDEIELTDTEPRPGAPKRAYVVTQTPLDRYLRRGLLTTGGEGLTRWRAGNRLGEAFHRAGLSPQVVGSYGEVISGGTQEGYRVLCMSAYKDYSRAIAAVRDGCRDVVYSVCCIHQTAGSSRRLEYLRFGLDDLVSHWRL